MKASREEVKEALSSDPTLFHEIDYDLQQYEKKCAKRAAVRPHPGPQTIKWDSDRVYRNQTDLVRRPLLLSSPSPLEPPGSRNSPYIQASIPVSHPHPLTLCPFHPQAEAAARQSMPPPPPKSPGDPLKRMSIANRRRSSVGTPTPSPSIQLHIQSPSTNYSTATHFSPPSVSPQARWWSRARTVVAPA